MLYGLSNTVWFMWLMVFPGCIIFASVFFKTNIWKKIMSYYDGWLEEDEETDANEK